MIDKIAKVTYKIIKYGVNNAMSKTFLKNITEIMKRVNILPNKIFLPKLNGNDNLYNKTKPTVPAMNTHIVETNELSTPNIEDTMTIAMTLKIMVKPPGKLLLMIFLKKPFLTMSSLGCNPK